MDIITDVRCQNSRVFITVSDGSLIQFGLDDNFISQIEQEKVFLIGAEITSFTNDTEKGFFQLKFKSLEGRSRFLEFSYDTLAQKEFEQRLREMN